MNSTPQFKVGDKFRYSRETYEVLTDGHIGNNKRMYLGRSQLDGNIEMFNESNMHPISSVTFTEAQFEAVESTLKLGLHIANWPIQEIMNTLRRNHSQTEGEAQ